MSEESIEYRGREGKEISIEQRTDAVNLARKCAIFKYLNRRTLAAFLVNRLGVIRITRYRPLSPVGDVKLQNVLITSNDLSHRSVRWHDKVKTQNRNP